MPMSLNPRKVVLILVAVPVAIFIYVTVALLILHRVRGFEFSYEHAGTDLTFASSDGGWRGEEDMMKGRQFADVLVDFELYRLRAGRPDVKLLRTKPWKRPYKWAWWFDRSSAPKWRVPYVPPAEVPRATTQPPSLRDATPAERAQAGRAAEAYGQSLATGLQVTP